GSQPAYLIERWYDYGSPHRIRIVVRLEADKNASPLMEIGSDGRSLIQYRYSSDILPDNERSVDARVTESEAQKLLPMLRGEPAAWFFSRGPIDQIDLSPLYLAQAREAGTTFLGQTSFLGRPAYLLTYRTDRAPILRGGPRFGDRSLRVVMTVDAQTSALL